MFSILRSDATRSIRTTLLLWLLPFAVAFMVVAWLIHGTLLERMSWGFVHERLHQEADFLERQVRQAGSDPDTVSLADTYFADVFHHVFALRIGERIEVSHPRWREQLLPWLRDARTGFLRISVESPENKQDTRFIAYRKTFELAGEPVVILVAEDYSLLQAGQRELHIWTAVVAVALLLFLVVLILLAVHIALRPVKQLRRELGELQSGGRERLTPAAPVEFEDLILQLNRLLDTLDNRLERSRQSLANLSHSIKTPVAALMQVLGDRNAPIDGSLREQMLARLSDLDRQLEAEMHRSRFAGPQAGKSAAPAAQVREIVWMLGRLYEDKQFELEEDLEAYPRWPIEEHDFNELIGNLVDNAGKWARHRVVVTLAERQGRLTIAVSDDGPGVAPALLRTLGTRGLRLDEQVSGHGLGLAIARDIVDRYGGRIAFGKAEEGGLSVHIEMPGAF